MKVIGSTGTCYKGMMSLGVSILLLLLSSQVQGFGTVPNKFLPKVALHGNDDISSYHYASRRSSSRTYLNASNKKEESDQPGSEDVLAEAEAAIREAEEALASADELQQSEEGKDAMEGLLDADAILSSSKEKTTEEAVKESIEPLTSGKVSADKFTQTISTKEMEQQAARKKEITKDALAAALTGLVIGGIGGGVMDATLLSDVDLDPAIPPFVLSVGLGAGTFGLGSKDTEVGKTVRSTLGGASKAVGKSIKGAALSAAESVVTSIKAIPGRIKNAIVQKADDTKKAIENKADQTKRDIQAIPSKIQKSAQETAKAIGDEVKATPGRVATKIEETVEETVDAVVETVENTVDEVKAFPKKKIEQVRTYTHSNNSQSHKP